MEDHVEPTVPEQPTPPTPSEWYGIWRKAIGDPSDEAYHEIARRADTKTAYIWLAIAYFAISVLSFGMVGAYLK